MCGRVFVRRWLHLGSTWPPGSLGSWKACRVRPAGLDRPTSSIVVNASDLLIGSILHVAVCVIMVVISGVALVLFTMPNHISLISCCDSFYFIRFAHDDYIIFAKRKQVHARNMGIVSVDCVFAKDSICLMPCPYISVEMQVCVNGDFYGE